MTRAAVLACWAMASCASYSNRMTATPLAPGAGEVGLAVDAVIVERGRDYLPVPQLEVAYRRGWRPGIDLGGKAHLLGLESSLRFALVDREGFALAAAGGIALGFEPITNNSTDVIYARALPRLIAEWRRAGVSWVATLAPSLAFASPATLFAGVTDAARLIVRPGAALAMRRPLRAGRAWWLELTAQPAYAIGDGWLAPSFQLGIAISL